MAAKSSLTKKQHAQAVAAAAKGRAAQKATHAYEKKHGLPVQTKAQQKASKQNIVRARAAQKARRAGKPYVSVKKPKARMPGLGQLLMQQNLNLPGAGTSKAADYLNLLPACGPVAVAAQLEYVFPWLAVDPAEVLGLHERLGVVSLPNLFEAVAEAGLAGMRLDTWTRCDEDVPVPGLVYGLTVPGGYHAVVAHPAGVLSWGGLMPWPGRPDDAWHLEWREL